VKPITTESVAVMLEAHHARVELANRIIEILGVDAVTQALKERGYDVPDIDMLMDDDSEPSCQELAETGRCGNCDLKPRCPVRRLQ